MSHTVEIRQENVQCDLIFPDALQSVYVDDLSQLALGVPVSKILFHTMGTTPIKTSEDGASIEQRNAALQLIIPTASLVNFAKHVLSIASQNSDGMKQGFNEYSEALHASLQGLTITPVQPPQKKP